MRRDIGARSRLPGADGSFAVGLIRGMDSSCEQQFPLPSRSFGCLHRFCDFGQRISRFDISQAELLLTKQCKDVQEGILPVLHGDSLYPMPQMKQFRSEIKLRCDSLPRVRTPHDGDEPVSENSRQLSEHASDCRTARIDEQEGIRGTPKKLLAKNPCRERIDIGSGSLVVRNERGDLDRQGGRSLYILLPGSFSPKGQYTLAKHGFLHAAANRDDGSHALIAWYARQRDTVPISAANRDQVRRIYRAGDHLHPYLIRLQAGGIPLFHDHIVRMASTVRRPTGYWDPSVHRLLRQLEQRGFEGAPRFLGTDSSDREIWTLPDDLPKGIVQRLTALCDIWKTGAAKGNPAFHKMADEGHLAHYESEIRFVEDHIERWIKNQRPQSAAYRHAQGGLKIKVERVPCGARMFYYGKDKESEYI